MNKALILIAGLTAALIVAGCTSPTTNTTTPSMVATDKNLNATLDAYFAARYALVSNFTRVSEANGTPVYSGFFQDREINGTLHGVTIYLANSTTEAQGQFEAQRASYLDIAAMSNATINATISANTSTHWAVTTNYTSISGWLVQPKTAGPFGLSLDVPYVLVSEDIKPPTMTTENAVAVTNVTSLRTRS